MIALPDNADKATTAEWMGQAVSIARRLARMMGAEFVLNDEPAKGLITDETLSRMDTHTPRQPAPGVYALSRPISEIR